MQRPNTSTPRNPFKYRCPHCAAPLMLTRHSPVFHCRACDTWGPNTRWVRRRTLGDGSGYTAVKPRPYRGRFRKALDRPAPRRHLWAIPSAAALAALATTLGLIAF